MEGLGTSPREESLWTVPRLQPGRRSLWESAIPPGDSGQRHPHSKLEVLSSMGVGRGSHGVRKYTGGDGVQVLDQSWRSSKARLKALGQLEGEAPSRQDFLRAPMCNSKGLDTSSRSGQHRGSP